MSLYPSPTTGLGVAAKIAVEGNQENLGNPSKATVLGYNNIVLSVSGNNGPTTFQLNPQIQDVASNDIDPGTAFVLSAVSNSSPGPFTLTAVANSANGEAVYTGTITGGNTNAFIGHLFTVAGFNESVNNGVFDATGSNNTTLTLANPNASAETEAATATDESGTAVYTGTITGGNNSAFEGDTFVVAGFNNSVNNGTFIATASNSTTLTLENNVASYESEAATATLQESAGNKLTYIVYPAKTNTGGTYQPVNGGATAIATISADGLLTAVAPGGVEVEVAYPTFNNTVGAIASNNNPMNGSPILKVFATINVTVLP